MKKLIYLVIVLVLALSACAEPNGQKTTQLPVTLNDITQPSMNSPTASTDLSATTSVMPEIALTRPMVSVEQAKNVTPSIPVSLDKNKNLVGLAEKSPDLRDEVRNRVWALTQAANQNFGLTAGEMDTFKLTREDFTQGRVFFNQDATSGQWILYFKLGNGNIMHRVISYGGGGMQWFDYPATYDATATGITGDYLPLAIPGGEEGVVWFHSPDGKVVIPQFVASPKTLADGSRVYTQALHYGLAYEVETWTEIPGTESLAYEIPTPEAAIAGTEIIAHYSETIRAEDTKYNIPVTIITDEKMIHANPMMTIDKIYINDDPNFKTRYGETAKEAIAHAVAYAEYQCWQKNDPNKVNQRAGVSFNTYWRMVQEAQAGTRNWSDVEFQTWANDLTTSDYDVSKRNFRPGNYISIIFVNDYSKRTISIKNSPYTFGTGIDVKNNLVVFVGAFPLAASVGGHVLDTNVAIRLSMGLDRLSWKSQGNLMLTDEESERISIKSEKTEIFKILTNPKTLPNWWSTEFPNAPYYTYNESAISVVPNDKDQLFLQP